MSILITGASGHLGRLAVQSLLDEGVPADQLVAGARDTSKISDLADLGVQTTVVDYDQPDTLASAFVGVDKVLFISGSEIGKRETQHSAVVDAAKRAGVQQLAYTSAPFADTAAIAVNPDHKFTEAYIRQSAVPYTILRNNWYVENYLTELQQARESGVFANSLGDGLVAGAPRADYAAAAAKVLTTDGHANKTYELGASKAWSMSDLAAAAAEVLGKDVRYEPLTPEAEHAALLAAGLPEEVAGFVATINANVRDGLLSDSGDDLEKLLGRPTTPLVEAVRAALS